MVLYVLPEKKNKFIPLPHKVFNFGHIISEGVGEWEWCLPKVYSKDYILSFTPAMSSQHYVQLESQIVSITRFCDTPGSIAG